MASVNVDSSFAQHPLTVDDYLAMCEAGILGEDDRVELIDGVLIEMPPPGPRHSYACMELIMLAVPAAAAAGLRVPVQDALGLDNPFSLPQPDLAIVPPPMSPIVRIRDAVLVVEISVTSLRFDLGRKAQVYAADGIPEYWVLDIDARELVVHRDPGPMGYGTVRRFGAGEEVSALRLDLRFPLSALL